MDYLIRDSFLGKKQRKSQIIYKKLAKNLFVSKKVRTFAPAFETIRALERW